MDTSTDKTAIAVKVDSSESSERGTFSGERLFRLDGRSVGIDTCRELSDEVCNNNEGLECQATQGESEEKQEVVYGSEHSYVDMNALMAAECLEYSKVIYSVAEDLDTAVNYESDYGENTAKSYSAGEEEEPRSFYVGDNKPSHKPKLFKAARRASFYADKQMQHMHAYYTDYSNSAVTRLIGNGLMADD
ncbi:hypothetical protein ACQ4LE_007043 [Meloidogyne hapla]|uniref:Uncharacterized protein n=1 Tax=Meloidogyne hapla TaxID=6305 RepID=A0A1I8BUI3_MELHA